MENLFQSVLILIAVLTSAIGAEEVIYAQLGETITLKPPEGYMSSKFYLTWYFGNVELGWFNYFGGKKEFHHSILSDGSLRVTNIQKEHFGTFNCKVTENGQENKTTYKIIKLTVSVNSPVVVLLGEHFALACDTETLPGRKKPKIQWQNPQEEKRSSQIQLSATKQHHGQWTCVVTDDKKIHKAKISVLVIDLSPAPLQPQYTSKSSHLTIPCVISPDISWEQIKAKGIQEGHWQFFPKPSSSVMSVDPQTLFSLSLDEPVVWRAEKARGLTAVPGLEKGNMSLTRASWTVSDRGDYVCTLKFKNGVTLSRTVHVDFLQISASPEGNLISGQQLNLTCSLSYPLHSDMEMKLIAPEQSSQQPLVSHNLSTHLTIPGVDTSHGGNWACELWQKDKQLIAARIKLKIEPKLSVWMLVIICSVPVIVLLSLILIFILHQRRKQKTGHLRHRLCKCKNPKPKGFYRT